MFDDSEIEIPSELPVMSLEETVLFPHAILPLYIFEDRFRVMLEESLSTHRLFAIFNKSKTLDPHLETIEKVGTVGVIRASHKNSDGTSNLVIQGLSRVRMIAMVREEPFPVIKVEPMHPAEDAYDCVDSRRRLAEILLEHPQLTDSLPEDYLKFLNSIEDPDVFLDVSAYAIVTSSIVRQRLLENRSLENRYLIFEQFLQKEIRQHIIFKELQGETRDDEIDKN
jgi:ATP-dependent Lon protease